MLLRVTLLLLLFVHCRSQKCSCEEGVTYEGHNLTSYPVNGPEQCCGLCSTTGGCKAVVLRPDPVFGHICQLTGAKATMRKASGFTSCKLERSSGASPRPKPPPRPPRKRMPRPQPPTSVPDPFPPFSTANPATHGYRPVDRRKSMATPLYDKLCFEDGRQPLATNHWWVPATLGPNARGKNYLTELPYVLNAEKDGLEISYPWLMVQGHIVQNIINRHWTMAPGKAGHFCVKRADEITATIIWGTTMESTLVRGSPYVTAKFNKAPAAEISTMQGIRMFYVDDNEIAEPPADGGEYVGHKFGAVLRDSDEFWVIYVPPGTKAKVFASPSTFSLHLEAGFTGTCRLALINNCTTGMDGVSPHCPATNVPNIEADPYIDDFATAIDQGSNVCTESAVVTVDKVYKGLRTTFHYKNRRCWDSLPDGYLTMIALPHHLAVTPCTGAYRVIQSGGHRNLRGLGLAVQTAGHKWELVYPDYSIDWIGHPDKERIPTILHYLKGMGNESDMHFDVRYDMKDGMIDPYNMGKLLAKMGRLVLIANQLNEPEARDGMLDRMRTYLSRWLDHTTKNLLIYDTTWGGVISCGCRYVWIERKDWPEPHGYPICANDEKKLECPTLSDPNFDFGNAYYNDHHFHYGYFIYSAAVVARFDPAWAKKYNEKVLMLIRDIANPSPDDPYFTTFRYFDFFVGHSWALGIYSDPNGKGQESTSEAVNAWYGIYLYGQATKQDFVSDIGETLLLMEIHSTNFYWHVPQHIEIYPKGYTHTMVGILHDLIIEFQTYFGAAGFFVHGIQLLPITPVVHLMFHPFWVQSGYPRFKQYCERDPFCTESGFVTFMIAEQAMIDKEGAWKAALKLPDRVFALETAGGNGNSRTNTLYFISAWGNDKRPHWPAEEPECTAWDFGTDSTQEVATPDHRPIKLLHGRKHHLGGTVVQGAWSLLSWLTLFGLLAGLMAQAWTYRHRFIHIYALLQPQPRASEQSILRPTKEEAYTYSYGGTTEVAASSL